MRQCCQDRGWVDDGRGYKTPCSCDLGRAWSNTMEGQIAAVGSNLRALGRTMREEMARMAAAFRR